MFTLQAAFCSSLLQLFDLHCVQEAYTQYDHVKGTIRDPNVNHRDTPLSKAQLEPGFTLKLIVTSFPAGILKTLTAKKQNILKLLSKESFAHLLKQTCTVIYVQFKKQLFTSLYSILHLHFSFVACSQFLILYNKYGHNTFLQSTRLSTTAIICFDNDALFRCSEGTWVHRRSDRLSHL